FKTYGILILISSLTGLFCGFIVHLAFPKYYKTRLLMESTVLNNTEQGEIIDNWDLLMRDKKNNGRLYLEKELNCSDTTVKNILSLETESLPNLTDGTNCFVINLNVRDPSRLKNVEDALLYGLRNNDYVRQKVAMQKEDLQREISKADGEMTKLDSTRDFLESLSRGGKNTDGRLIFDISNIANEKVEIGEKLAAFKEKLAFGTGVQLVRGGSVPLGPKPGMLSLLGLGLLGGFLIGYFAAFIKSVLRIQKSGIIENQ
ncbi:MAG TPA: hypothetical protein VG052_17785, partial [Puia sp.]|nr:hypothetical protein [Puia sp.]